MVGGGEGADRSGDLRAGHVGVAGGAATRCRAEPGVQVAPALRQGALSAVGAGEEVVPASEYRALQHQVRELQRLLGKKTLENEVLRDALELVQPKKRLLRSLSPVRDDTL